MTTTILRVVAVLAASAGIALAGAGGARAADPTLGATVESRVYVAEDDAMTVWNRSTVEARLTFEATGGWTVEPRSLVLAADEKSRVVVSGDGEDGSVVSIVVRGTAPVAQGHSESVVALESRIYHARPFDPWGLVLPASWVVVVIVTVAAVLRRLRPWEYRVARRPT